MWIVYLKQNTNANVKSSNKTDYVDYLKPNTNDMFNLSLQVTHQVYYIDTNDVFDLSLQQMHQVHYIDTKSTKDKEQLVQQQFDKQGLQRKNKCFIRAIDKLEHKSWFHYNETLFEDERKT